MRTLILCGGRGTRAYPHTIEVPKPLLEVGGRPVLEHVMEIYANQGFRSFVLSVGFKGEMIEGFASGLRRPWDVEIVDTGLETNTGERIRRCRDVLGDSFFATYADGLADIDLVALRDFHAEHPGAGTMTTVPLRSQYGTVLFDEAGCVERFREKPQLPEHWINAGFFVFDRRVFDLWSGEDLERDVLPEVSKRDELYAYRHTGFWKSMDTYKDALELDALCTDGPPPWTRSQAPASS